MKRWHISNFHVKEDKLLTFHLFIRLTSLVVCRYCSSVWLWEVFVVKKKGMKVLSATFIPVVCKLGHRVVEMGPSYMEVHCNQVEIIRMRHAVLFLPHHALLWLPHLHLQCRQAAKINQRATEKPLRTAFAALTGSILRSETCKCRCVVQLLFSIYSWRWVVKVQQKTAKMWHECQLEIVCCRQTQRQIR